MACSCRIVISACSGGGNPTLVSVCSKSSLDHLRRMWSSDSHTPMMYKDSSLDRFGPSEPLYGRVYRSEAGVYLLVAPHLGANDPDISVGWACNDYWAVQVWGFDGDGYRNDCDRDAVAAGAPSLEALGWPHPLSYAETLARATRLSKGPVMVSARYRFTDGGFKSHVILAGEAPSPITMMPNMAMGAFISARAWPPRSTDASRASARSPSRMPG